MKNLLFIFSLCVFLFSCQNSPKSNTAESTKESTSTNNNNAKAAVLKAPILATNSSKNLQGIDISHYQTDIDWNAVKTDSLSFVIVKATAGETYLDPSFKEHWSNVKNAGLMRGAYHFYYTKDDPIKQAKFFISNVLSLSEKSDLPPIIDIETDGVNSVITPEQLQKDLQTFLSIVETQFDRKAILYTSHAFAQKYIDNPVFDKYYLWIAEYDSDAPIIPDAWSKTGWTFWQNTPSATVNGIKGDVDHDFFNGDLEAIKSL